jgi:hypothetical protein
MIAERDISESFYANRDFFKRASILSFMATQETIYGYPLCHL